MRENSQQAVDRQMQQHVHNYRYDNRQSERESLSGRRTWDESAKWRIERIRNILYESKEAGIFPRCEQLQQEPDRQ